MQIAIHVPEVLRHFNTGTALKIRIDKISLSGFENKEFMSINTRNINPDKTQFRYETTDPDLLYAIKFQRQISKEDLVNVEQNQMPGFRLVWSYDPQTVENFDKFISNDRNMEFIR